MDFQWNFSAVTACTWMQATAILLSVSQAREGLKLSCTPSLLFPFLALFFFSDFVILRFLLSVVAIVAATPVFLVGAFTGAGLAFSRRRCRRPSRAQRLAAYRLGHRRPHSPRPRQPRRTRLRARCPPSHKKGRGVTGPTIKRSSRPGPRFARRTNGGLLGPGVIPYSDQGWDNVLCPAPPVKKSGGDLGPTIKKSAPSAPCPAQPRTPPVRRETSQAYRLRRAQLAERAVQRQEKWYEYLGRVRAREVFRADVQAFVSEFGLASVLLSSSPTKRALADNIGLVGIETNPGPFAATSTDVASQVLSCTTSWLGRRSCRFTAFVGPIWDGDAYARQEIAYLRMRAVCHFGVLLAGLLVLLLHRVVMSRPLVLSQLAPGDFLPRGRSLNWASERGKTVCQAWLVSRKSVLITTRGPESSNPEFVGTDSGVGGSLELGEDPSAGIAREVREEVGIDIDGCDVQVGAVEVDSGFTVVWVIVYLADEPEPCVPASEKEKVISPRWVEFSSVDTSRMHPRTAHSFGQCLPKFYTGAEFASCSSEAQATWLRRGSAGDMPPGLWSLRLINNRDGLCVPYAMQAVSGLEFDFADLAARVPPAGYDFRALAPNPADWACWSADRKAWVVGNPETAKYFLFHKMNGKFGHVDGLVRASLGEPVSDTVFYPTGRGGFDNARDEFVAYAMDSIKDLDGPAVRCDTYRQKMGECLTLDETELSNWLVSWHSANLNGGKGPSPNPQPPTPPTSRTPPPPPDPTSDGLGLPADPSSGAGDLKTSANITGLSAAEGPLKLTGSLDTVSVVADRRVQEVPVDVDSLYTQPELGTEVTFGAPASGYDNLGRLLLVDSVADDVDVVSDLLAGTVTVYYGFKDRLSQFFGKEILSFIPGLNRHTEVIGRNMVPGDYADKYSTTVKEFTAIFAEIIGASMVLGSRLTNWVTTVDEVPGASYAPLYERLWAGWLAAAHGATLRAQGARNVNGHGGGNVDPHFNVVFPNQIGFLDVFDLSAAPVAGWPKAMGANAVSGTTMVPLRISGGPRYPTPAAGRDWRVVLYHLTSRYMDLESPASLQAPNLPRTRANLANAPSFFSMFDAQLPSLMFVCDTIHFGRNNAPFPAYAGNAAASMQNPDAWRDALVFMLQAVGGSEDAMQAFQNVAERWAYFYPGDQTHLANPLANRIRRAELVYDALRRRLLHMRLVRPNVDAGNVADPTTAASFKLYSTAAPAGVDVSRAALAAAAAAPGWATVRDVLGAAAAIADLPAQDLTGLVLAQANGTTDAMWHQYFQNVTLDGPGSPALSEFLSSMPEADWESCRLWLSWDWSPNFPAQARPVAAQIARHTVALRNRAGADLHHNDRAAARALSRGLDLSNEWTLPLANLVEQRTVVVPNGVRAMRSAKVSARIYHDDTLALVLARRLADQSFTSQGLTTRFALLAVQMRAGIDAVTASVDLNASTLRLRTGEAQTGVVLIDRVLEDTNEYVRFGKMGDYHSAYVSLAGNSILNAGYPSKMLNEFGVLRRLEFADTSNFVYDTTDAAAATEKSLLLWRTLHPVTVRFFRPDVAVQGGPVVKDLDLFGIYTQGAQLPWEDWVVNFTWRKPVAALGALRIVLSVSGAALKIRAIVDFLPTRGRRVPREHEVLSNVSQLVPRYGIMGTHSPVLKEDLFSWYHCPLVFRLRVDEVNGDLDWIRPAPIWEYGSVPRTCGTPAVLNYNARRVHVFASTTAAPNPNSAFPGQLGSWAAGGLGRSDYIYLPGMSTSGSRHHYSGQDGLPTRRHASSESFFSVQQSGNYVYMRSPAAVAHATPRLIAGYGHNVPLAYTGPNGNAMVVGFFNGALAGMSQDARFGTWTEITYGDPRGQAALGRDTLQRFYALVPVYMHRWERWYSKMGRDYLPVILSPRLDIVVSTPSTLEGTLTDLGSRALADSAAAKLIGGFRSQDPDFMPAERTTANFDPRIIDVPIRQGHIDHFLTGFSSTTAVGEQLSTEGKTAARKKRLRHKADLVAKMSEELAEEGFV